MDKRYDLIVFDWNGTLSQGLDVMGSSAPLCDGASRLLATLKQQGYWLAVASNMATEQLRTEITAHNIQHYFMVIYGIERGFAKPHPYMLEQILAETGVDADRTLMVGDTANDMAFAHHAGVDGVWLTDLSTDLEGYAQYCVPNLQAALSIV